MLKIVIGIVIGGAIGATMGYYGKCTTGACPLTATPWRGGIYGSVMGALFALSFSGGGISRESVPEEVRTVGAQKVVHVESQSDFDAKVQSAEGVVLLDVYADWCGPCKALAPVMDKLAYDFDGRAVIAKLDVDRVPGPPKDLGVTGVPAVFLFQDGKIVNQWTGIHSSTTYTAAIEDALSKADTKTRQSKGAVE